MAKLNRRQLDDDDMAKIRDIVTNVEIDSKKDEDLNPLHMFKGGLLSKTLTMLVCWITVCLGFYALTLNATKVSLFNNLVTQLFQTGFQGTMRSCVARNAT